MESLFSQLSGDVRFIEGLKACLNCGTCTGCSTHLNVAANLQDPPGRSANECFAENGYCCGGSL